MAVLRGWEEIKKHAKIGDDKLKDFVENHQFPVRFLGRDPYSTTELIDDWFKKHINGKTCQDPL